MAKRYDDYPPNLTGDEHAVLRYERYGDPLPVLTGAEVCAHCGGGINPRFQESVPFCGTACKEMARQAEHARRMKSDPEYRAAWIAEWHDYAAERAEELVKINAVLEGRGLFHDYE